MKRAGEIKRGERKIGARKMGNREREKVRNIEIDRSRRVKSSVRRRKREGAREGGLER